MPTSVGLECRCRGVAVAVVDTFLLQYPMEANHYPFSVFPVFLSAWIYGRIPASLAVREPFIFHNWFVK
jgi:hypothetical protein